MVRFRAGQRWQYPRTGKGTLSGRLCTLAACQNSRAGTAYSPHIVFFSSATVRTEFSAVGSAGSLRTLHCSDTCRNEVLIGILPRANVKNSTSPITANLTLPSALRTWQEAMRYAISSSKAVSLPKTSRTYGKRNNSRILAICSRASWTIFHS